MCGALASFLRSIFMAGSALSSQVESEMLFMLDRFTRTLHMFATAPEVKSKLTLAVSSEMRQLSRKSSGRHSERSPPVSPYVPRHAEGCAGAPHSPPPHSPAAQHCFPSARSSERSPPLSPDEPPHADAGYMGAALRHPSAPHGSPLGRAAAQYQCNGS
mmetsp:Transcript_53695/g.123503  ORF Transcript_53695/g.123503 Transcript_53695/m.123503 type:complete len:159 (-) Transcript_53695:691-1167(-)